MPALIEVDSATERLRDGSLAVLAAVYVLPLVWVLPPSVNVAVTASLTVFSACLRTVGRTNEAELVSKKVIYHFLRIRENNEGAVTSFLFPALCAINAPPVSAFHRITVSTPMVVKWSQIGPFEGQACLSFVFLPHTC